MHLTHIPLLDFHTTNFVDLASQCGARTFRTPSDQSSVGVFMTNEQLRTFAAFVLMQKRPVDIPILTEEVEDGPEADDGFLSTEIFEYPEENIAQGA